MAAWRPILKLASRVAAVTYPTPGSTSGLQFKLQAWRKLSDRSGPRKQSGDLRDLKNKIVLPANLAGGGLGRGLWRVLWKTIPQLGAYLPSPPVCKSRYPLAPPSLQLLASKEHSASII